MPARLELRDCDDFPPVPTADWEAAIRKDLKGADYEKKLVWRTDEGVAVRPYYRGEDIAGLKRKQRRFPASSRSFAAAASRGRWLRRKRRTRTPSAPIGFTKPAAAWSRSWDMPSPRVWSGWRSGRRAKWNSSSRSVPPSSSRSPSCALRAGYGRRPPARLNPKAEASCRDAPPRPDLAPQQEHLRPLYQPAAGHHRSSVGGDRRLRAV